MGCAATIRKTKLALVIPNLRWGFEGPASCLWHFFPYNMCLLAAMVEAICDVDIIDAYGHDMTDEQLAAALTASAPTVVGITVSMDQCAPSGHHAAALAKSTLPHAIVVMGGVYPTMNARAVVEDTNVDFAVVGEGEYVFRALLEHLRGEGPLPEKGICYRRDGALVDTGRADFIEDLDGLPLPAYHLVDIGKYMNSASRKSVDAPPAYPYARILTSRGCPQDCVFCQVRSISGRKYRPRSAENVLDEIAWLKDTYGVRCLYFDDDNLYTDRKRARAIFQGMVDRGLVMPWVSISTAVFRLDESLVDLMRVSGCRYIDIAIESGSERVLKEIIRKPIDYGHAKAMVARARQQGIYVAANFIVGFPTETWDEILQTIRFAEELDADYVKIFVAIPLRHTRLWELCERENAFKQCFSESGVKWNTGQIETKDFSSADLTILRAYEWDRINFADPAKRERTAQVMGVTQDELLSIRRDTLRAALDVIRNSPA